MSTLTDAIMSEVKRPGTRCGACKAIAKLNDAQRAELDGILVGPTPSSAIAAGLSKVTGMKVPDSTLAKHRRGKCSGL